MFWWNTKVCIDMKISRSWYLGFKNAEKNSLIFGWNVHSNRKFKINIWIFVNHRTCHGKQKQSHNIR